MQADKTTINDLSIFHYDEEQSVFHHINFTRTVNGKEWLKSFLNKPLQSTELIRQTQQVIQLIISIYAQWPQTISNGTIMVMEKFYETQLEEIPRHPSLLTATSYRLIYPSDYSLAKYSIIHFIAFTKGLIQVAELFAGKKIPAILETLIERIEMLVNKQAIKNIIRQKADKKLTLVEILRLAHFIRRQFRDEAEELIEIYSRLDAYYSMATACINYKLVFPEFIDSEIPMLEAEQLYHPLLPEPVAYSAQLTEKKNFLFLTGANMAGKSTFIKAVGVAVYLAHIGMGVPAKRMTLTKFDGLLSNIQVVDNIIKGESYFFNEVQRIRKTIERITDGKKWLILIDELFKGTNVQDAMKCSTVVIEGLLKMRNALFILSTHLYEIGESLKQYSNIQFHYFETEAKDDQLVFSYSLKEGISNDRLGYLILKKEGVVDMLNKM